MEPHLSEFGSEACGTSEHCYVETAAAAAVDRGAIAWDGAAVSTGRGADSVHVGPT